MPSSQGVLPDGHWESDYKRTTKPDHPVPTHMVLQRTSCSERSYGGVTSWTTAPQGPIPQRPLCRCRVSSILGSRQKPPRRHSQPSDRLLARPKQGLPPAKLPVRLPVVGFLTHTHRVSTDNSPIPALIRHLSTPGWEVMRQTKPHRPRRPSPLSILETTPSGPARETASSSGRISGLKAVGVPSAAAG